MKRLLIALSVAGAAVLSGCAGFQDAFAERAAAGAGSPDEELERRPYPKSSGNMGF